MSFSMDSSTVAAPILKVVVEFWFVMWGWDPACWLQRNLISKGTGWYFRVAFLSAEAAENDGSCNHWSTRFIGVGCPQNIGKVTEYVLCFSGRLSYSGDLLLWVGVRNRASSGMRRPLSCVVRHASSVNIFFVRTTCSILTKFGMYHL